MPRDLGPRRRSRLRLREGWRLRLVSDRLVVLEFVDEDGDRATEDLLDQAVGVELSGQLHACLDEALRDQVCQRRDGLPGVRGVVGLVEPQAAGFDPAL